MAKDARSVDHELIRELANLLKETDLSEIEIESDNQKIRVARTIAASPVYATSPSPAPAVPAAPATISEDKSKNPGAILSPMVGTAYRAPEPGAKTFVEIGTEVRQGQTLLIIEAMKTMNAIPAPKGGRVEEILVEDGQPIEFGQPLIILE